VRCESCPLVASPLRYPNHGVFVLDVISLLGFLAVLSADA
jgi:hypothetical protein